MKGPVKPLLQVTDGDRQTLKIFARDDPEAVPDTISKTYLPLKFLKLEYRFNEMYIEIVKSLRPKFACWRKIRGDGNCYYRAVISSYLIKLFHPYRDNSELQKFIRTIESIRPKSENEHFSQSIASISRYLKEQEAKRRTMASKIECFVDVNHKLQNKKFDIDLVSVARAVALGTIDIEDESLIKVYIYDLDFVLGNICSLGKEAEGIELKMLPVGLDIKVTQYNNDAFKTFMENVYCNDLVGKEYFEVYIICKTRGHYDSLYSVKDLEVEEYDFYKEAYQIDLKYKGNSVG